MNLRYLQPIAIVAIILSLAVPTFAQRSHAGGGPPAGRGPGSDSGMSGSHGNAATTHGDLSHGSPSDVLSHNTAIAGKIKALTGKDAAMACDGFKNLGQCVAAAHVAKNLDIPGGFDALKAKVTGKGSSVSEKPFRNSSLTPTPKPKSRRPTRNLTKI